MREYIVFFGDGFQPVGFCSRAIACLRAHQFGGTVYNRYGRMIYSV